MSTTQAQFIPTATFTLLSRKAAYVEFCAHCGSPLELVKTPVAFWQNGPKAQKTPAALVLMCDHDCRKKAIDEIGEDGVLSVEDMHPRARDRYLAGPDERPELFSGEPIPAKEPEAPRDFPVERGADRRRRDRSGTSNRVSRRSTTQGRRR